MKRIIKSFSLFILLFLLVFAVPSAPCSAASQKTQVKKSVNQFFRYAKKMKVRKMEKCFVKQKQKIFSDPQRFYKMIRPYSRKMTWKIKKIKLRGRNRAAVKVRVKFRSLYISYWNSMVASYRRAMQENGSLKGKKYMLDTLESELQKNGGKPVHTTIRIQLRRVRGKWKIVQPEDRLMNVLYCDYVYASQDFMGTE